MEKIKFAFGDGNGEDEFFVLEQTKKMYEIVEDDTELLAVSKVFEELLEDVSIEM